MKYFYALNATLLSALLLSGCGGSSDSDTTETGTLPGDFETAAVEFSAESSGVTTTTNWNDSDFNNAEFNLCIAEEPLNSGIDDCASYQGGQYFTGISAPFTVPNLTPGSDYWVLLQVRLPDGEVLLSPTRQISIAADDTAEPASPGPYAGLGPFKTGSIIRFYELDSSTGQRVGSDPVATTTIADHGRFDLPDLGTRWVEAEVTGDFLDLYSTNGFTDDTPVTLRAIFDTDSNTNGRNIQIFTHWMTERARWLLVNNQSGSLADAVSTAKNELEEDLELNHPAQSISFQLSSNDSVSRLDDSAKLLAISSWISLFLTEHPAVADSYAQNRFAAEDDDLAQLLSDLSNRADFYADRAFNRLGAQIPTQEAQIEYFLIGERLSGCAAAKVFRTRPMVCLGDDRDTFTAAIPGGSGTHQQEIFFHPRRAGMWAVELTLDGACAVSWNTFQGETGSTTLTSHSFNGTVGHHLAATRRLTPSIYRIVANFNQEDCAAEAVDFNFRKVAIGHDNNAVRGLYFLQSGSSYSGVVGAYQSTSGSLATSSSRSYYFLNHFNDNPATYRFAIDYRSTGSGSMTIHVEERSGTNFIGIGFTEEEQSPGQLARNYQLRAGTQYRVWVENLNPRTTSTLNFNSYSRFNYELSINDAP